MMCCDFLQNIYAPLLIQIIIGMRSTERRAVIPTPPTLDIYPTNGPPKHLSAILKKRPNITENIGVVQRVLVLASIVSSVSKTQQMAQIWSSS